MIIKRGEKFYQRNSNGRSWDPVDESQVSFNLAVSKPAPEQVEEYNRQREMALWADAREAGFDDPLDILSNSFPRPRDAEIKAMWGDEGKAIEMHMEFESAMVDSRGQ